MRALTANRNLMTLLFAEVVTNLGTWVTTMAIFSLLVFRGDGGVGDVSLVLLAGLGPMLLASPVAGVLADRYDRKWLMIASQLLSAVTVLALIFAPSRAAMLVLLALSAAVGSLMAPARQSAMPQLVARDALTQANALFAQINGVLKLLAPLLAGALLAVVPAREAMLLDVVSFVAAALILTRLPALRPVAAEHTEAAGGAEVPTPPLGLRGALREQPRLALLFVVAFLAVTAIMGFDILSTIVTRDVLAGNEALFGVLVGLVGLGTIVASALLTVRAGPRDLWQDVLFGLLLLAMLLLSVTAATLVGSVEAARWLLAAGCLAGGFGSGFVSVQVATLIQRLTPPALLGRASGAFQSTIVAGQLVAMAALPLLVPAHVSPGTYAAACAAVIVAVVLAAAVSLRRLAETPLAADVAVEVGGAT